MAKFKTIDIDREGFAKLKKPVGCIDYTSDEWEADFVGNRGKILLRIKSIHKGWANDVAREVFNSHNLSTIRDE